MYIVTSKPNLSSINSGFVQVIVVSLPRTLLKRFCRGCRVLVKALWLRWRGPVDRLWRARDPLSPRGRWRAGRRSRSPRLPFFGPQSDSAKQPLIIAHDLDVFRQFEL